jgi:hypothetical protein
VQLYGVRLYGDRSSYIFLSTFASSSIMPISISRTLAIYAAPRTGTIASSPLSTFHSTFPPPTNGPFYMSIYRSYSRSLARTHAHSLHLSHAPHPPLPLPINRFIYPSFYLPLSHFSLSPSHSPHCSYFFHAFIVDISVVAGMASASLKTFPATPPTIF